MAETQTPLSALAAAVRRAARYNAEVECAPHCILWPDREAQWQPIIPALQTLLPELLVFGPYDSGRRGGPAIWLRCVLGGQIPEVAIDTQNPPILYLPGISRQDLRAVENCSDALKPLAELQYRGVYWTQVNAKDWTVLAFLVSGQGGLDLDVSNDRESKASMLLALPQVMEEPLSLLREKRLDATYFNTLLTGGDPVRDLLQWMDDAEGFRQARSAQEWTAFESVCRSTFAFQPKEGVLAAAEKLARHAGAWEPIWQRYCEAPQRYPRIPEVIRRVPVPNFDMFADANMTGGWPQWNVAQENSLRADLAALRSQPPHKARERIVALEATHAPRRALVWAALGEAPLAQALEHLALLARATTTALVGGSLEDLQAGYAGAGWQADDAVLRALECGRRSEDLDAITTAIRSVYLPWIEDSARYLQKVAAQEKVPGGTREGRPPAYVCNELCVMFVDGLRFDAAKRLAERLSHCGLAVSEHPHWVALPSVTATGKAAVLPIAHRITGMVGSVDFEPAVLEGGAALSSHQLKKLLTDAGWEYLGTREVGTGRGHAWCEVGDIDSEGHNRGWKLALHLDAMLQEIGERIEALIAAGWSQVRVVTDHGWLLMPGGLPKSELPKALVDSKWGRCAAIKAGARSEEQVFPWYWNPDQTFALADGVSCYRAGEEYAHGGLSLQECLTLQLAVTAQGGGVRRQRVQISDVSWKGLRLVVALEAEWASLTADIRNNPGDPASSVVVGVKPFKSNGTASLVVENEDLEGQSAFLVILDEKNNLVAQQAVTIGSPT